MKRINRSEQPVTLHAGLPEFEVAVDRTAAGFRQPVTEALRNDVANHLEGDVLRSIRSGEREIGYAVVQHREVMAGENEPIPLVYLAGIIIEPRYQGRNIAGQLIDEVMGQTPEALFGFRTQSSIMYAAVLKRFERIAPSFGSEAADLRTAGTNLAEQLGSRFPLHRECYGGPLYGEKPEHCDPKFQAAFDRICPDFEAGDAVLCIASGYRKGKV